ncbi:MAG: hypothetical protein NT062_14795 [Proteobacteria bacterium]|nr:hypothetical protein [Pseudomonadota bacterium]
MQRTLLALALFTTACTVVAAPPSRQPGPRPEPIESPPPPPPVRPHHDEPPPPPERPMPPPFSWDTSGWTMLGERIVDGKVDADTIQINTPGTYNRLTVVVLDSDLEMIEMHLFFKSGKHYATDIKNLAFRENTRTRVLQLPSELLTRVDFKYRNLPGGGRALVQLWGTFQAVPKGDKR